MLERARREMCDRVAIGASARTIDAEVEHAAPDVDDEGRAALWLYGWHCAGEERVMRPQERIGALEGRFGR